MNTTSLTMLKSYSPEGSSSELSAQSGAPCNANQPVRSLHNATESLEVSSSTIALRAVRPRCVPSEENEGNLEIPISSPEFRQYVNGHVQDFKVQFAAAQKAREASKEPRTDQNSFITLEIPFCLPSDAGIVVETTKHLVYEAAKVIYLHWCIRQPAFNQHVLKVFNVRAKPTAEEWLPHNILYLFMDLKTRKPGLHPYDSPLVKQNDFWVHLVVPPNKQNVGPEDIYTGYNRLPCLLSLCHMKNEMESNSSFPPYSLPEGIGSAEELQTRVDRDCSKLFKDAVGYMGGQRLAEYATVAFDCAEKRKKLASWRTQAAYAVLKARLSQTSPSNSAAALSSPSFSSAVAGFTPANPPSNGNNIHSRHQPVDSSNRMDGGSAKKIADQLEEGIPQATASKPSEHILPNKGKARKKPCKHTGRTSGRSTLKGKEAEAMDRLKIEVDNWLKRKPSKDLSEGPTSSDGPPTTETESAQVPDEVCHKLPQQGGNGQTKGPAEET